MARCNVCGRGEGERTTSSYPTFNPETDQQWGTQTYESVENPLSNCGDCGRPTCESCFAAEGYRMCKNCYNRAPKFRCGICGKITLEENYKYCSGCDKKICGGHTLTWIPSMKNGSGGNACPNCLRRYR